MKCVTFHLIWVFMWYVYCGVFLDRIDCVVRSATCVIVRSVRSSMNKKASDTFGHKFPMFSYARSVFLVECVCRMYIFIMLCYDAYVDEPQEFLP